MNVSKDYLIYGAIAAGAAGLYFLFKGLKKKNEIILQYYVDQDLPAAQVIKGAINPGSFIKGYVDINTFVKPLVMVGGSFVNPTFGQIATNLGWPDITAADAGKGFIFAGQFRGINVWGVAGYAQADTYKAATYIKDNGLPTSTVVV